MLCVGVLGVALPASPAFGQQGAQNGEWRSYGGDAGSTKYSNLDAIDASNVQDLQVVWRWQSVDYDRQAEDPELTFNNLLLATPLKVGNALYTSTNLGQAAAIDPVTGETLWVYNSVAEGTGAGRGRGTRGLAYWTDGSEGELRRMGDLLENVDARMRLLEERQDFTERLLDSGDRAKELDDGPAPGA